MSDVLFCQAWISLLHLPNPRAKRPLKLMGSNGAFLSWCNTRERFQEGDASQTFRSVSMETRRKGRFSTLLTFVEQIAVTSCPGTGRVGSRLQNLQGVP